MKIAVCGKGGSGKSTVVALLALRFREKGKKVLIVDSDESNSCLHWMLGFNQPPSPLMDFVGGKKHMQETMLARFSRGEKEPEMSIFRWEDIPSSDIPDNYVAETDGLRLVAIGKILQALEGCACPMGTLSKEFLKKLRLAEEETAVVDMEAGIEHFGRGIETSVDKVLAVVEPSMESIFLAQRIKELTSASGADFAGAMVNKVNSKEVSEHLEKQMTMRRIEVLATIPYQQEIQAACLAGERIPSVSEAREIDRAIEVLQASAEQIRLSDQVY